MIIVTGSVSVRPERIDEAIQESLTHVHRSRREPGCITHAVHRDVEDPNVLVFIEEWESMAALQTHFMVPESGAFVATLSELATTPPVLRVFDAKQLS